MSKPKLKVSNVITKTPKGMPTTFYIYRLPNDIKDGMESSIAKIKTIIELLKTDENLNLVLNGIVGSITEKLEIPIGHIPYFPRQMGIEMGTMAPKYWVINSIFNREPFLTDENTLVKKTAYLIRYMYSIDDFNEFPLSLIANPSDDPNAGFQMLDVLLAKDRGHFITVLYDLVHNNTPLDKSFWTKVKNRLSELTNRGKSTPASLKNFQEVILEDKISKSTSNELTLKDIVPSEYFNKIYTHKETLKVRLETIDTHKSEISGINDEENKWTPHNYGLSDLTADFIKDRYYDFNITLVEKECFKSDTLLGKKHFLSSRHKANFSGFETEPVFLILANKDKTIEDKDIYSSLAGSDKDNRGTDYSNAILHQLKTQDAKEIVTKLNTISNLSYLDTTNSLWLTFNDALSQSEDSWKEMRKKRDQGIQNGHFQKLKSGPMDTALFYYFTGDYLVSKLGHRTGVTTPSVALKQFIEWWIEEINTNQNKFWKLIDKVSKSWSGRYELWMDYIKAYIKYKEVEDGKTISVSSLRKSKLLELRQVYSEKQWPHIGQMYDRNSNGWIIVDYDLTNGKGFNVCHYTPDTLGGRYTHENTDMGPELDNKQIVKDNRIPSDYFGTNGDFYKKFKEEVEKPEFDSEEATVYLNTLNLAKAYDIIYNKRKQFNESISNS